MPQTAPKCSKMPQNASECFKKLQNATKCYRMLRMCQLFERCLRDRVRGLKENPACANYLSHACAKCQHCTLQTAPKFSKMLQNASKSCKMLRNATKCSTILQNAWTSFDSRLHGREMVALSALCHHLPTGQSGVGNGPGILEYCGAFWSIVEHFVAFCSILQLFEAF